MRSPLFLPKLKRPKLLIRRIAGGSMRPGFMPGRIIIAVSPVRRARVGDVVIVRHNGHEMLKRISQLESGRLYLLGDDLAASTDSRDFGWLEYIALRGKVVWPRRRPLASVYAD